MRSVLLAFLFACLAAPSRAQPVCTLPDAISRPAVGAPDYRNPDPKVDYLALVLSWSPEHCARQTLRPGSDRHDFQCRLNRFEFVVHGLWPQSRKAASSKGHPRHCKQASALAPELVRRHLCTVPGADLMQHQWQAHGTCHWSRPEEYFSVIEALAARFARPGYGLLAGSAAGHGSGSLTAGRVKQAFVDLNNGALRSEHVRVSVARGNHLREVWICLTPDATRPMPMACPPGGTPDGQAVRIRPPH